MTDSNVVTMTGSLEPGQHRLAFLKSDMLTYPDIWSEVYVQCDPGEEKQFAEMFIKSHCYRAKSPESADIVVFGGGVDVNPILYNENRHPYTSTHSRRDEEDIKLYELCLSEGIPMLGICRGAQFLHVMNGGKLYQDIDGHQGPHAMWDVINRAPIGRVSSVHHQSVRKVAGDGMEVLADTRISKTRWLNDKDKEEGTGFDIEAFFYPDTCCLGFQGHPEYRGYSAYTLWCLKRIEEYLVSNPDLELSRNGGRNRALSPAHLALREERWEAIRAADEAVKEEPCETAKMIMSQVPVTRVDVENVTEDSVH